MESTKTANINGDTLTVKADFAQASSPIQYSLDGGEYKGTPFQVADVRHSPDAAIAKVNAWLDSQA